MLANNPLFLVNFCSFQLALFYYCKAVFAENIMKIVFSAEHSFCVSQIVKRPFEAPSPNGTFATKSAIFGFSPVFANCLRNAKKPCLFTTTQNTLFFCVFFWKLSFPFFHLFSFSNITKTKTKIDFFRIPFLDTSTTCKNVFSHPYTLFVIFPMPKQPLSTCGKQANNLGPSFDAPSFDSTKTQILHQVFDSTAYTYTYTYIYIHIYIDLHIYICAVRLGSGPMVAISMVRFWPIFLDVIFL